MKDDVSTTNCTKTIVNDLGEANLDPSNLNYYQDISNRMIYFLYAMDDSNYIIAIKLILLIVLIL